MDEEETIHLIGLSFVDLLGPVITRSLLEHCGSAKAVFKEKKDFLRRIPGMGEGRVTALHSSKTLGRAEDELNYCREHEIKVLHFKHPEYPRRLLRCSDAPLVLYQQGDCPTNTEHAIAVVGTRGETSYGRKATQTMISEWAIFNPLIVSGLALGIDTTAHEACLQAGVPTVAVLGHSLDRIYPYQNKKLAERIREQGALISEFPSGTKPDAINFPRRNRIVAGMTDATVVVEAAEKGGALITGQLAASYNRDVFALPGRITDRKSAGCLQLIKNNEAHIINHPMDVPELLRWESDQSKEPRQIEIPIDLSTEEAQIISALASGGLQADVLSAKLEKPISQLFALLTNLELKGLIRSRPGKRYEIS